jgi:hypothetical protein
MHGTEPAEARRLFEAFLGELWDHRHWDSDFTPSPYDPGARMRELVDGAGPAAVPLLLDALTGTVAGTGIAVGELQRWACAGLERLGPAAGDAAAAALAEHVSARRAPLPEAAVALAATAPGRAWALGVHRWPETMGRLALAGSGFVERFLRHEGDDDIVRLLALHPLRDRLHQDCPPAVADLLRGLLHGDRGPAVRRAAAEILTTAAVDNVTEEHIEALRHGGPLSAAVAARVAAHPASERLIPRLVEHPGAADALATLIMRRRCAGLATDPAPLREFLRLCVEQPQGRWPAPRYGDAAPTAVMWLRDETALAHLLPMLHADRLNPLEHTALVRAFASAPAGRTLLEQHRRRHPEVDRVQWVLDEVRQYATRLDDADDAFLRGRIETPLGGAFTAYARALLAGPSAHAAFQLAWIDRAFGAPVTTARTAWIRGLGFADDGFLAELARPVERPLGGLRPQWDRGETGHDPARAARAAAAGLPSLASRWCHDDTLDRAARDHLARVRHAVSAAAPPATPDSAAPAG